MLNQRFWLSCLESPQARSSWRGRWLGLLSPALLMAASGYRAGRILHSVIPWLFRHGLISIVQ